MYKLPKFLFRCSLVALAPIAANAAGTYYTGNYQSPQQRYSNQSYSSVQRGATYTQNGVTYNRVGQNGGGYGYNNQSYANQSYAGNQYNSNQQGARNNTQQNARSQNNQSRGANTGNGFTFGGGISRETAMWRFELKESDSILRFDDVNWNALDLHGAYDFNLGNTAMRVNAGFKYGMQAGDASMTDDDITNGGYFVTQWLDENNNIIGNQLGHSLSIGTSEGGNMLGFNVGVGLVDVFKIGNLKMTPSVGYRYMKYKLENKKNYGLAVETAKCFSIDGSDEIQCDPILIIHYPDGKVSVEFRDDINILPQIPANSVGGGIDAAGTYYYQQPGVSHSYEVEWSGPYLAMDMTYDINQNNSVNGYVELGFPGYTSTGDQPYRFDWQHPKSVEDKAGMFSAFHLGLGANWMTAVTDTVSLSLGVTYDYYTVSDADANTYLNGDYYMTIFNNYLAGGVIDGVDWGDSYSSEADLIANNAVAANIDALRSECPGWVCKNDGEVESFYKSLGVRLGIVAKF